MLLGIEHYDYATRIAKLHNITVEVRARKRKRPACLTESVVYESIGSRETLSASEEFKTQLYFPVLDKFLDELNRRFHDQNVILLRGISACTPTASNFLSHADLHSFSEMYGIQAGPTLEVEVDLVKRLILSSSIDSLTFFRSYLYSCRPAYNILYQLAQIALTIAFTSAESEQSFSALKRIKTRLRSTMAEDRLSALAILSIEREIAEKQDYDTIIDEFASADKNRRIVLF